MLAAAVTALARTHPSTITGGPGPGVAGSAPRSRLRASWATMGGMCGRYANAASTAALVDEFDVDETIGDELPPSWNIAPTDPVRVVLQSHGDGSIESRQLTLMRWGLVPPWAADESIGARLINARAETVTTTPAFRAAAAARRCLVPADGWYEWAPGGQPYYLATSGPGGVLAFAGLYERRRGRATCAIVTTGAVGRLSDIHDRMPLVLPRAAWASWLDPDRADPGGLLAPAGWLVDGLELRPVGKAVGNVANNGPELQRRVDPAPPPLSLF